MATVQASVDATSGSNEHEEKGLHDSLVKMWTSFFDICDHAHGQATKGQGFQEDKTGSDLKKSGIPNDDAAKDQLKRTQEQQGMAALLDEYGPDALRESWWNLVRGDDPDRIMLRFVRARKGDLTRALAMMATCLKWRLDTNVEVLVENGDFVNGKEIPKFTEQQESGKVFALGSTTKDQPICYVIMKHHSIWSQPAASMQKFIITQLETIRLFVHPPNDKITIFFDLKGFGLKQMDVINLLFLVKVLESYYPESLGTMYISNAPWIFWGFWRGVKNLLDPVVRDKIKFISSPSDSEGDVDREAVIQYCGGDVTTRFDFVAAGPEDVVSQTDNAKKSLYLAQHRALTDKFEQVTRAWCKGDGDNAKLGEERQVLAKKLRLSQFRLEPYVRGSTVYHRNGMIPTENRGISVFDYEYADLKTKPSRRQVLGKKTCQKATEQQLYDIVRNGLTVAEAEAKTSEALKADTWGEWAVNDNSTDIREVAEASLTDLA